MRIRDVYLLLAASFLVVMERTYICRIFRLTGQRKAETGFLRIKG